ncbi:MAG: hypothetical protein QUS11_09260 [Candidatus Fermentibacter sp.]|nr:hypothetical protein [Candidatus Fermentibacter sp.]
MVNETGWFRSSTFGPALMPLALVLASAGCHDVTEYSSEGQVGVAVVDRSGMTVEGVIKGFEGGRAICSVGGDNFIVSSNRGRLYWGDAEELTIENMYTVGLPFSSGYGSIAPGASSVYVIGGYGKILQFSLYSRTVIDEFEAGPMPAMLCRACFAPYIYVADGQEPVVREVWMSDNTVHAELELPIPTTSLTTCMPLDTLGLPVDSVLIAASRMEPLVYYLRPFSGMSPLPETLLVPVSDADALQDSSLFYLAHRDFGEGGRVTRLSLSGGMAPGFEEQGVELEGSVNCICVDETFGLLYAACYGSGVTRIYEIDALDDMQVLRSVDLDGYAWDMTLQGTFGQRLLVLTTE